MHLVEQRSTGAHTREEGLEERYGWVVRPCPLVQLRAWQGVS
jgi:hypothetical protein